MMKCKDCKYQDSKYCKWWRTGDTRPPCQGGPKPKPDPKLKSLQDQTLDELYDGQVVKV